ncbi:hypothetical protein IJ117_02030 [Candidatus Saccharibacteria bacterium]|nr:hypothetical protein [Candidatus Saccharibacteria bacterium]
MKSSKLHQKRPRATLSHLARSKESSRKVYYGAKRTILTIIILAMMAVILSVILVNLSAPDRIITAKIQEITSDYYENYFYDRIGKHNDDGRTVAETAALYADKGFTDISLRQLLYYGGGEHQSEESTLSDYCDLDNTYVRIFPTPPYGRADYRVDYHYSCEF